MAFGESTIIATERLNLRLPVMRDFREWVNLRETNAEFLRKWEPRRRPDQHSWSQFKQRVGWSRQSFKQRTAIPLLMIRREDRRLIGAITLDRIQFGPSHSGALGYWMGQEYTGKGYMSEAVARMLAYAFTTLDLSRIEAATLEENLASQRLLERTGFRYEGVAQSYLQIDGRWRAHRLYANLRRDRLGNTETGVY